MRKWVMVKEKIVKEDGRYLIYYRFKETRSLSEKYESKHKWEE